ncbi:MAG: glycosyltransferase family 2 protein [Prevotella sp.]|nr:glycosyltransferase family 2 protein [Prevotella sp.]
MAWYTKYLSAYGQPFDQLPPATLQQIKAALAARQSAEPLVSVVVIAHNEEQRLAACLWSLSELIPNYDIEILGVDNHSTDQTARVYSELGLPYYYEERQSPGFARQCGLDHARGKYHFFIDADTLYPQEYVNLMMTKLSRPEVSCVGTFWSFYPDEHHSAPGLFFFELLRDLFLWVQHFKRPELCVRGMTFAFRADYARQTGIRTDLRRGEDGSLALALKKYGKIVFLYDRHARPVTGYGTLGRQSLLKSFVHHALYQLRGIGRIFHQKDHYDDSPDNLIKQPS